MFSFIFSKKAIGVSSVLDENNLIFIPFQKYSAYDNMAIDDNLAKNVKAINQPILRFYGWKPYAISTGYNQSFDDFDIEQLKQDGFDIVQRPTGGRAIFHSNELTYAIIIPKQLMSKFDLYRKTHFAFSDALKKFRNDIALSKKQIKFGDFYKDKISSACFAASARYEVSADDRKIIGSAQRVYSHSILQHGSIMLGNDHLELVKYLKGNSDQKKNIRKNIELTTTYFDLVQNGLTINELCERFLDCIVKQLGINSIETKRLEEIDINMVSHE
jgi:lipoate-protein ligase A